MPVPSGARDADVGRRPARDYGIIERVSTFAMYADWRLDNEVDDAAVMSGSDAIEISDPEACIWRDEADARVVRFSFDVDAMDFNDAWEQVKRCLAPLATAGLPGKIVHMEGFTDTHLAKWEPDEL